MAKPSVLLRAAKCLALAAVLWLAPSCFGELVVIKVLNGGNGAGVANQLVTVQLRYAKSAGKPNDIQIQRTDSDGEMRFLVHDIRPESLDVKIDFDGKGLKCSCRVKAEPETVLREGLVVGRGSLPKNSPPIQAEPAHIVFIARPSSFLEKVMYEY